MGIDKKLGRFLCFLAFFIGFTLQKGIKDNFSAIGKSFPFSEKDRSNH